MERKVLICGGTGCTSSGSMKIADKLEEEIKKKGIDDHVKVVRTGCFGLCALGPIMIVYPEGTFYSMMSADHIEKIVEEHLVNDRIVEEYVYEETKTPDGIIAYNETNFYKKQHRVALRNCGVIDPENIDDYLEKDGYKALEKVVTEMTPEQVIDVISKSGLRGRGGGGFPTGRKWQMARTIVPVADQKYVCCNADEGDPGAFMDRSVLEGDPHAIIEAMAIAGYAIGATKGFVYVRAEYPIAVHRLQVAIGQARERGYLRKKLFGSDFEFDLDVRLGAGAFVCGEETALITSIEGNRGEPKPRPPFPAEKGIFG
ncbi:MAG: NAD(P)H-dependent oxidoreductase subunit E, partial [Ruminiclostridium sp.]|nr:NAD(P)H-dependent oxidoreductase subunit E [Ruminiclostridium sp.]